MDKAIELTLKLHSSRDIVKRFLGDDYDVKIKPYKELIETHKVKFNFDTLPAVLEICNLKNVQENGILQSVFLAAAVDIIEEI